MSADDVKPQSVEPSRYRGGGIAASVVVSVTLHAAVIGLALLQLDRQAGFAVRSPSVVSLARNEIESLETVETPQSTKKATVEAGADELIEQPAHDLLESGAPSDVQTDAAPRLKENRISNAVETKTAAEPAALEEASAEMLLPAPPIESIEARDVAPPPPPLKKSRQAEAERKQKQEAKRTTKKQEANENERARDAKREAARTRKRESDPKPKSGPSANRRARASASAGAMSNYAARVRAAVARRKPRASGARGTAVVSFGLTSTGRLAHARLSRSSGNGTLDRLAIGAVRGAAFPRPPAGATSQQLRFTIPFHFR